MFSDLQKHPQDPGESRKQLMEKQAESICEALHLRVCVEWPRVSPRLSSKCHMAFSG